MLKSTAIKVTQLSREARISRGIVFKFLDSLRNGRLIVEEKFADSGHGTQFQFGEISGEVSAEGVITIFDESVYSRILKGGSIAAAEAYIEGLWDSPDLTLLTQLMAANADTLDRIEAKTSWLTSLYYRLGHFMKRNSLVRAKENIHAHYDIGNSFYQLFLDEKMLYSSALFEAQNESLGEAQINKLKRLCEQLELKPSDHVIEIGTGWGAMAVYMAEHYGCRVTTTTISEEQYHYVKNLVESKGLGERITLLNQDYRELKGKYDKLVSIEMIEAVGKQYLNGYIEKCNELLNPRGKMAIQAITIADQRYESYSRNVDFIQKYIFPGGFLPSINALLNSTSSHSEFNLRCVKDIGLDYAQTLKYWRERFEQQIEKVRAQGYDERFIRMWRYYLCYCEGGFLSKSISTVQLTFEK
ncbi:SAM-dependent methyltransferase [Vibrio viridaestus]|uniref:Class I SAM-dependent methyltransferase n=1 Tax=Vibrio viridaestus TaxID=2487322 RepID=A0A3N9TEW9_9VIBR|nr:cyclopropane-fatty-acyl-phospholipid synthase family protein [Vibrio viridaestus]RQW61985.1 class I SAM-dependent methyltransferase [Vibrio viridaestus]